MLEEWSIRSNLQCVFNFLSCILQVYDEAFHALHKELPDVTTSVFKEIETWIGQRAAEEAHQSKQKPL